jgi:hypothetical protein
MRSITVRMSRHPLYRVWWLQRASALKRRPWLLVPGVMLCAVVAALIVSHGAALLQSWQAWVLPAAGIVTLQTAVTVQFMKQRAVVADASDWLSTLPLFRAQRRRAVAANALLPGAMALLFLLSALMLLQATAAVDRAVLMYLCGAAVGSTVIGSSVGWWVPFRRKDPAPAVRTIFVSTSSKTEKPVPSLSALSQWPHLQLREWCPPSALARVLMPLMLALPMGISGNLAVALLSVWGIVMYLGVLCAATLRAAGQSRGWLRSVSITPRRYVLALGTRMWLRQLQWTVLVTVLLVAMGVSIERATHAAELWLSALALASAATFGSAAQGAIRYLHCLATLAAVAAANGVNRHLILPSSIAISAWQIGRSRTL